MTEFRLAHMTHTARRLHRMLLNGRRLERHPEYHGTLTGYGYGCRCDSCLSAGRDYNREYRRQYRAAHPSQKVAQREGGVAE